MKVQILNKKLVKPCTPTPRSLRTYKLSCMDQLNTIMHVGAILYYADPAPFSANDHLEKSLAQILPQFYPLAGRYIREYQLVDCSDQGAEFIEAQVMDHELLDIIGYVDLNDLLPRDLRAADEVTDPILSVQVTKFKCGGTAIGLTISHRIFDARSMATFISAWAKASRGDLETEPIINPNFDSPFYFPADFGTYTTRTMDTCISTKRILFDRNAIAALRGRVSHLYPNNDRPPSKVVVVSSFLAEALMRSDRAKHGQSRPCVIMQEVDIRERTAPPLSTFTCGNLVLLTATKIDADESKSRDFECMVPLLRNAIKDAVVECGKIILSNGEGGHKVLKESFMSAIEKVKGCGVQGLRFTDWSKFKFYEADFGFGRPMWVSVANVPLRNLVLLINTKDNDGIEAWVNLHEKDMPFFELDKEIKRLTSSIRRSLL